MSVALSPPTPLEGDSRSKVPFHRPDLGVLEKAALHRVLDSGWLTTGKVAREFEREFAGYLGVPHALGVNSATTASLLVFEALGVGPGDDVVFPAWTFSGPAMMAHKLGARVVLADVDPRTLNMTPESLEKAITSRTKLVVPTHFGGAACDIQGICGVALRHGAMVVDDAAHAFPSTYPTGEYVGAHRKSVVATFFSYYATKTVCCGEGGMIATFSDGLREKIQRSRQHGFVRHATHSSPSNWT